MWPLDPLFSLFLAITICTALLRLAYRHTAWGRARKARREAARAAGVQPAGCAVYLFLLLPLGFVLFGVLGTWMGGSALVSGKASESWPSTAGVVTRSEITCSSDSGRGRSGTTCQPDVRYRYRVGADDFRGRELDFDWSLRTQEDHGARAAETRGAYEVGDTVAVFYDPASPGRSVLRPGYHGGTWGLLAIGALFLLVGAAFFPFAWRVVRGIWREKREAAQDA